MNKTSRVALALGSAVATLTLLAACGAGGSPNSTHAAKDTRGIRPATTGTFGVAQAPDAAALDSLAKAAPAGVGANAGGSGTQADPTPATAPDLQPSVIRTGAITMTSPDPATARGNILALVHTLRGTVADEQSGSDTHGHIDQVDLSLRIPSDSFDSALEGIRHYGTVLDLRQSAQDVTTQVIDVAARVKAQQASVDSIRQLLARATTIGQVMAIESVLSSRQAALDSLVQQQKYLADQTSMSTIAVHLTKPAHHAPKPVKHTGFLGGLYGGWHALGRAAVAVGAAIGAVLPFAVLLVVIGVPVRAAVRSRRRAVSAN